MAEHTELDAGLWLTVTELAARKGVGKSTISEKVKKLVDAGRLTIKPGEGKKKLINLAQYDSAIGEIGDAARESGAATKSDLLAGADVPPREQSGTSKFRDEQTREKAYKADMAYLALEKARGNLLDVAEFDAVAEDAASRIGDIVDGLLARDSDLTAVAITQGENGMRTALKGIVRTQREAIVAAMKNMAITARNRAKTVGASVELQPDLLASADSE